MLAAPVAGVNGVEGWGPVLHRPHPARWETADAEIHSTAHWRPSPVARRSRLTDHRAWKGSAVNEPSRRRECDMTSQQEGPTTSYMLLTPLRRRFSEGIERKSLTPSVRRVGRFSDGLARLQRGAALKRVGSFA